MSRRRGKALQGSGISRAGLLVSSYGLRHTAQTREPAGDNAPAIVMLKQATAVANTMSQAATTHRTVQLASAIGTTGTATSAASKRAAPIGALLAAAAGMVDGENLAAARADAASGITAPGEGRLPHQGESIIAVAAKAGLGVVAGQSVQIASGDAVALFLGADTQFTTGGQLRMHTGQAIGMLGGAMAPGANGIGLQLIAGRDSIDVQAQNDTLTMQARDEVNVMSANAHIDWAAAKSISLSTAGGANITIEGGNITVQCPGKIIIHAGAKKFSGPARTQYNMPVMPNERNTWVEMEASYDDLWNTPWPVEQLQVKVDHTVVAQSDSLNELPG